MKASSVCLELKTGHVYVEVLTLQGRKEQCTRPRALRCYCCFTHNTTFGNWLLRRVKFHYVVSRNTVLFAVSCFYPCFFPVTFRVRGNVVQLIMNLFRQWKLNSILRNIKLILEWRFFLLHNFSLYKIYIIYKKRDHQQNYIEKYTLSCDDL